MPPEYPVTDAVTAARARSLDDWLRWQQALHHRSIDLGLKRVARVAAKLGLPARNLVTLTIGGTNGKGSSAALTASIYREAGYRVGLYTSPHLYRYNERVVIDGKPVSDADLCRAFTAIEMVRGEVLLTYFEFGTLAALWLFREAGVQVQVLEVGLGGRLDATNLADADAALVTSIGLDHQEWLGDTRDKIAVEKAGIFRRGHVAVSAEPSPPETLAVEAGRIGARLLQRDRDFRVEWGESGFDWHGPQRSYAGLPLPGMSGNHQIDNAAGVIALVEAMQSRVPVPETALRAALPQLSLPGRFEQRGALILDVAHNVEAAQALARQLEAVAPGPGGVLVLGMLEDKPHAAFVSTLLPHLRAVVCLSLPPPRGLGAQTLLHQIEAVLPASVSRRCHETMREAMLEAAVLAGSRGRIVVTGSFVTVELAGEFAHG